MSGLLSTAYSQTHITGRASVIDGDTIEIRGERIRLHGIDAPEARQQCVDAAGKPYRCGAVSAEALDQFLAGSRPTTCSLIERDRYRRFVGICQRADGASVQSWMVRNGHALDWPRYSKGVFAVEQDKALAGRAGIWQGRFIEPWTYRAKRRKAR